MIHNDSTPILRHPRTLGLIAFAVCTGLLGTAFYMEYVWYLEPCPLCMAQRVAFALFGLIGLIAALTPPTAARVRALPSPARWPPVLVCIWLAANCGCNRCRRIKCLIAPRHLLHDRHLPICRGGANHVDGLG